MGRFIAQFGIDLNFAISFAMLAFATFVFVTIDVQQLFLFFLVYCQSCRCRRIGLAECNNSKEISSVQINSSSQNIFIINQYEGVLK
jgi:hypothetical protein